MQIIRNISRFESHTKNHIVTIGNYDGIHLGHQEILKKVSTLSQQTGLPNILITFEPLPREYFLEQSMQHYRLMNLREKINTLKNYGIEKVLILRFNDELAHLSAESFITQILINKLKTKYLVVGEDFKFGHKNSGNVALLQKYSKQLNFQLTTVPLYKIDSHRVSSTLIRKLLQHDDLATAAKLLGQQYSVLGRIIHGDHRGRELGFPTANIHLTHKIVPLAGVYAVKIHNIANDPLYGVANIGFRPTTNNSKRLLEVNIFDFDQDIYHKIVKVEFIYKLRNETKFANFTLLQQQVMQDIEEAKKYFATT